MPQTWLEGVVGAVVMRGEKMRRGSRRCVWVFNMVDLEDFWRKKSTI